MSKSLSRAEALPKISDEDFSKAYSIVQEVISKTPLERNAVLSERYGCNVFLKREDLQSVRSFKIRGAYNFIRNIADEDALRKGVVCASAGNHAQGVAYSCQRLDVPGAIFMPTTTPRQKVSQVEFFGGSNVEVHLIGDTFDDAFAASKAYCDERGMTFVHPFDDKLIIAGQGTIGIEIVRDMDGCHDIDFVFMAVGGGGLASGVGSYLKRVSPATKVIGVEPAGAPSMRQAIDENKVVSLPEIEKFVDGAAVKRVGNLTYDICKEVLDDVIVVPEGKICTTILQLYNENAIVAEPAGALAISALDAYQDKIAGKNVICIVSGGNNDIDRMQEIKERSLIYEGLMHYFIIHFPQRAGALREFIDCVVGPDDDITRFEYTKKNNREAGPALVGIELKRTADYSPLIARMEEHRIQFVEINKDPSLFHLLI